MEEVPSDFWTPGSLKLVDFDFVGEYEGDLMDVGPVT